MKNYLKSLAKTLSLQIISSFIIIWSLIVYAAFPSSTPTGWVAWWIFADIFNHILVSWDYKNPWDYSLKWIWGGWTVVVVHSLSSTPPTLPADKFTKLWEWYSYAGSSATNGYSFPIDITRPESCVETFIPLPVLACNWTESCNYNANWDDMAMWLSAWSYVNWWNLTSIATILPSIWRCSVFMSKNPVIVKNDFKSTVSDIAWYTKIYEWHTLLWFSMESWLHWALWSACLQNFAPMPFVECNWTMNCNLFTSGDKTWWWSHFTANRPTDSNLDVNPTYIDDFWAKCALYYKN